VEYAIKDSLLTHPLEEGVTLDLTLNYKHDLNLEQSDFRLEQGLSLYSLLSSLASRATHIIVYGYGYQDGSRKGVHDVHLNSGECNWTRWKNRPSDGLVGFDFLTHIQWIPIKFKSQYLSSLTSF